MKHLTTITWQALLVMCTVISSCNHVKQKVGNPPGVITPSLNQVYLHDMIQRLPKDAFLRTGQVSRRCLATRDSLFNKRYTPKTPFVVAGPGVDGTITERMKLARKYAIVHLKCSYLTAEGYTEFINELLRPNDDGTNYYETIQTLYLIKNQITDIRDLTHLINLKSLYLIENKITDIGALRNLTNLQELSLKNNRITDIGHLTHMTNLEVLDLSNNQITDVKALTDLTKLRHLTLNNGIAH